MGGAHQQPVLCVGPGLAGRLGRTVGDLGHHKVMLVTDADVARLGLHQTVLDAVAAVGGGSVLGGKYHTPHGPANAIVLPTKPPTKPPPKPSRLAAAKRPRRATMGHEQTP